MVFQDGKSVVTANSSTQETYQRTYGRLDLKKRGDSERAKARKTYALIEKERNTEISIPTLHDTETPGNGQHNRQWTTCQNDFFFQHH